MAIVHADNFSIYGTSTGLMLNGIYAQTSGGLSSDPDGVSPGRVYSVSGAGASTTHGLRYVLNTNATKLGIAGRWWFPALPTGSNGTPCPFMWRNVANNDIACLTVDSTGRISARQGSYDGSILQTTTNPVITANGWYHVEALIDYANQTFEVRVEGVPVIELDSLTLTGGPFSQIFFGTRSLNTSVLRQFFIKDVVVYDGTGSYNNDFIGSALVTNLTTTADVALNWTPSTGSNGYSILDNIPPNDSQYIFAEDDPLPSPYVADLSQLPDEVTSVKALITFVRAAKSDGGDGSLQVGLISDPDGTPATALGADRPITVAQTYWRDVFEEDPATSAPWLPAAVNDAQLQINRTT
jgi:hypothetical protein